jgi:hypothetical protein
LSILLIFPQIRQEGQSYQYEESEVVLNKRFWLEPGWG